MNTKDTNTEQLEKFRKATSVEEIESIVLDTLDKETSAPMLLTISETLDEIYKTHFAETSPDFRDKYLREIQRLRVRDALNEQLSELKEICAFIKKYNLYETQVKCSHYIFDEYTKWKEARTSRRNMEDFVAEERDSLEKVLVEKYPILRKHVTEHDIKKMIRFARNGYQNPTNGQHSLVEPTNCPPINYDLLNSDAIHIEYCKKSDAELLAVLGKQILLRLIPVTCEALDTGNTGKLYIILMEYICHDLIADTHPKDVPIIISQRKSLNYDKSATTTPTFDRLKTEYKEARILILNFLKKHPYFS